MHDTSLPTHYGRNGLLQLLLFVMLLVATVYGLWSQIAQIYVAWTLTYAGLLINGFIVLLFVFGVFRIAYLLWAYHQEEVAIGGFLPLWANKGDIHGNSLIAGRYYAMQSLHAQQSPIHQGALAASLQAREKARTATLRYINNVLILCGVFGTIVSLSMALVGASGLLEGAVNEQGMGLVIHGMSTALSTTMTAIACYFFFHYFLVLVENARMAVLASIEHLTTTLLAPAFHVQAEHIPYRMADLIEQLQAGLRTVQQSQQQWMEQQAQSQQTMERQLLQLARAVEATLSLEGQLGDDKAEQNRHLEQQLARSIESLRLQQERAHGSELAALTEIIHRLDQGFRLPEA
jgi:hypothetical protein